MASRVLVVQPYVPQYRVALFERLTTELASRHIALDVVAPPPRGDQALRSDSADLANLMAPRGKHRALNLRLATLQSYGTTRMHSDYDAVILPAMASLTDTLIASFRPRRHFKLGLWGHLESYVSEPNPVDRRLEQSMLRRADHLFAYTSSGSAYAYAIGVPESRTTTLNNTIDTSELRRAIGVIDRLGAQAFRATLGIPPHTRVFAYIGGLDADKRIDFVARVLDEWHISKIPIHLVVAGTGRQEGLLDAAIKRGQVTMVGYADSGLKAKVGATAEGILCPGRVGLVAVDAMALGLPVLTTDYPYHAPEIEYLTEGISRFTLPNDPQEYGLAIASSAKHEKFLTEPPRLSSMVESFANGIEQMITQP